MGPQPEQQNNYFPPSLGAKGVKGDWLCKDQILPQKGCCLHWGKGCHLRERAAHTAQPYSWL